MPLPLQRRDTMKGKPEEEVLRELMDDMNGMDKERLGKRRGGPSITIAIGVPKGGEEKEEMDKKCEVCGGAGCPECEMKEGMESVPGLPVEDDMSEEDEPDDEEDLLIEEAKSLGIPEPEYMDMRLLKKMVDRKKARV